MDNKGFLGSALPINLLIQLFADPASVRDSGTLKLHEKELSAVMEKASANAKTLHQQSLEAAKHLMEEREDHARLIFEKLSPKGTEYNAENMRQALLLYMYGEIGEIVTRLKSLPMEVRTITALTSLTLDHGDFVNMLSTENREKMMESGEALKKVIIDNLDEIKRIQSGEEVSEEDQRALVERIQQAITNQSTSSSEKMKDLISKARAIARKDDTHEG